VTDDQVRAYIAKRMETVTKDGAVVQQGA